MREQTSGVDPSASLGPLVLALDGSVPDIASAAFIAPGVVLAGAVVLGPGTSIWYGSVLRADANTVTVGRDVNIQDGCILHSDIGFPAVLGDRVSLGHGAIVHGAIVEDDVLICIRATVLNGARIGTGSLVAAGAVVRPGMVVPPGSLVVGVPAQVRRPVTEEEAAIIRRTTPSYLAHAATHRAALDAHRAALEG
jgi:carbonic anhydrase/acetyltransferase-like protein (isoleucine patch superfamily)